MKAVLTILGVVILLSSCKKDKIGGFSTFTDCPGMYDYRSKPLNMDIYDSVSLYYTPGFGCMGWEPTVFDTVYSFFRINPKNPFEIIYLAGYPNSSSFTLMKYNFCTNSSTIIKKDMINYSFDVSSKGWVLFVLGPGEHIYKIKLNGEGLTELPYFPTFPSSVDSPLWSPSGDVFISSVGEIYDEDGIPLDTVDFNDAQFTGWYDNTHILTSKSGSTYKVNINTGESVTYLSGEYNSYDYKSERFIKQVDSSGYQKWGVYNKFGVFINSTYYHFKKSALMGLISPLQVLNENKIITRLTTQEYYPDVHTPSCDLLVRQNIIIMDMDGTNVRKVEFPE